MHTYRDRGAPQHLGDPPIVEVLVEAQYEHRALRPGQAGQQRPDLVTDGELVGEVDRLRALWWFGQHLLGAESPASPRQVCPYQRGAQIRIRVLGFDPVPMPVSPGQDILHQILGEEPVTAQYVRETQQPSAARGHVFLERTPHPRSSRSLLAALLLAAC